MTPLPSRSPAAVASDPYDAATEHTNLTKDQLLVWAGQQVHPEHRQYSELALFHIHGPVDPERFRRAFDRLVDCSDALRTVFRVVDDWPQQVVVPRQGSAIDWFDMSSVPNHQRMFREWLSRWSAAPFPAEGPLVRSALIKLGARHFVWALYQHQLIADGWSFALIFKRVRDLYAPEEDGAAPDATVPPQFREYVEWERRYRGSRAYRQAAEYWAHTLASPGDALTFYAGRARTASNRLSRVSREIGDAMTAGVATMAARFPGGTVDLNMFAVLCAACAVYVSRISGGRTVVVGAPYANRCSQRFKDTVGSFMHVCPLHIEVDPRATALEMVGRVRAEALAASRHQQYAVRNPIHGRRYEIAVNYHKRAFRIFDFGGWRTNVEWPSVGYGNHTLTLQVRRFNSAGRIGLDFDLNDEAFGEEYRTAAAAHYTAILEGMVRSPEAEVGRLRLLSDAEARRIRTRLGIGKAAPLASETLLDIVSRNAKGLGTRLAVIGDDRALTYDELENAGGRIAGALRQRGIGRGQIVGVALERGVRAWALALGILKSGAAYLPLETAHPQARLGQILREADCGTVIVSKATRSPIERALRGQTPPRESVVLDEEDLGDDGEPPSAPEDRPGAHDAFYVIFTSGSTGVPKGIAIEHRGMVNHALAKIETLGLGGGDRVAQLAPMSFDVSVWQFFAPLCVGAQVHVIGDETARDPRRLLTALAQRRITIAATVPSMLRAIIEHVEAAVRQPYDLGALRWLVVTGEVLPPELCRRWLTAYPEVPIVNAYGPSECSDDVTHYVVKRPPPSDAPRVPIGRPIRNMQVRILDARRVPVPIGVTGELWIGGVGVGRGYVNDRARSAAAFVADHLSLAPGARLYRTGDLGWYRADGNIEFLGRRDAMVKIRGHRVEPGEVEAVLRTHPSVRDVAVVSREDATGACRLQAYVVPQMQAGWARATSEGCCDDAAPRDDAAPDTDGAWACAARELRRFVAERLPDFMVPRQFVVLDGLPLTPNGKVDRRALPTPERQREDAGRDYVAPRTSVEQTIAAVWGEVLDIQPVGVHDNLFELGGDSLLAAHIAYRIRERLLVEVPVHEVLEHPTVATLATRLEAMRAGGGCSTSAGALGGVDGLSETGAGATLGGGQ